MANFSFDSLANATGVASNKRLRPYTISKVKFVEAKVDILHSEKNNTDYDVLKVRFEGEEGYYEENLFLPSITGQDTERKDNNWGGKNPSNADRAMMFFAHLTSVLNHDGFEKLKKVIGKLKTFKDVATMVAKLLMEKKGTECYLKLCGRTSNGNVFASLPFYCSISKESGNVYVSNNFISLKEDLGFTLSEDKKRQEYINAKPTQMQNNSSLDAVNNVETVDNSDIDNATMDDLQGMLAEL
jgi:hypothetical protein